MVSFTLSKALSEHQSWALRSFPTIVSRATGYSEQWALRNHTVAEETGSPTWQYEVQGMPNVDLVVDHIIHELTDAVLLEEWHTVEEDRFTFGSMHRDRPEHSKGSMSTEENAS